MFLVLGEVVLVSDPSKRRENDAIVYVSDRHIHAQGILHEQTFWPAFNQEEQADRERAGMKRYGTVYEDTSSSWCIVPDVWNEGDALRAKLCV